MIATSDMDSDIATNDTYVATDLLVDVAFYMAAEMDRDMDAEMAADVDNDLITAHLRNRPIS